MPKRNGGSELRSFQQTKAKLSDDLNMVAEDAEELMRATSGELSEKTREVRERLRLVLEDARQACAELEEKAEAGIKATDRAIRDNPYTAVGIAAGVGLLVGFWLKRR